MHAVWVILNTIVSMTASFSNYLLHVMRVKHGQRPGTRKSENQQAHVEMTAPHCLVFVLSRKARVMLAGTTVTTTKMMMALLMTQKCMSSLEVTGTNQSTLASTSIR